MAWLVQNNHHRILRRRIRPHRPLIYRLSRAIYVVIGLCSEPIFAFIWSVIMGSSGTALPQLLRALRLGLVTTMRTSSPTPTINQSPPRHELCRRQHSSTRSNYSAELQPSPVSMSINNVELHRPTVGQQCRTPSTADVMYAKSRNVELHRQVILSSQWCLHSTMSNSIDSRSPVNNVELHRLSKLTRPVFSLEIAVELRHGELSSCATYTLNTCNLTSTRPSAASDSKKK